MIISKLIEQLEAIREEHGDIDVEASIYATFDKEGSGSGCEEENDDRARKN